MSGIPTIASLAERQAGLLQALAVPRTAEALDTLRPWLDPDMPAAGLLRGLQAYRSQAQELSVRVLAAACPVVAELVGPHAFSGLARGLWRDHPPRCGDLGCWGEAFADWLGEQAGVVQELPWLPDVARLEWALHRCVTAADVPEDTASLACLLSHAPEAIRLRLAAGVTVLDSDWPVLSIVQGHAGETPELTQALGRLHAGQGESVLVWRAGLKPCLRESLAGEPGFLAAVSAGRDLSAALSASPGLDFQAWLAQAVSERLLVGAETEST